MSASISFDETTDEEILKARRYLRIYIPSLKVDTDREKEQVIKAGGP